MAHLRLVLRDYGMLLVLLVLCAACSLATIAEHQPIDVATARRLAARIAADHPQGRVLVLTLDNGQERQFGQALGQELTARGLTIVETVHGLPPDAARALDRAVAGGAKLDAAACSLGASRWPVLEIKRAKSPLLAQMQIHAPQPYRWPTFLMPGNLRNVADQASVIAIIAVGMTMVIISGGIDLSVGSLMALSSVAAAILIREMSGNDVASSWLMVLCSAAAIGVCGAAGAASGAMVTRLGVPAFIVTLSWMMIASGLAYILSDLQTIEVPASYKVLGHGRWLGVPLPVIVMFSLYAVAHVAMTRTVFGRHLYAVGGNEKAAHLAGIRVAQVRTWAYVICGALAGLGGIIETSVYGRGDPQIGVAYELLVISAVVVGGTSLSGGEGKMLNTLIGSLIIAVIRNAMNLANLESNRQRVVLGLVILGAVLLDRLKRGRENRSA